MTGYLCEPGFVCADSFEFWDCQASSSAYPKRACCVPKHVSYHPGRIQLSRPSASLERQISPHNGMRLKMGQEEFISEQEWSVVERIKTSLNDADPSSRGTTIEALIASEATITPELEALKSASLKLNFIASSLEDGLDALGQKSDATANSGGTIEEAKDSARIDAGEVENPDSAMDMANVFSENDLNEGTLPTGVLGQYESTAKFLLKQGYYKGIISAIENCMITRNTFMIIDSPSGSGKTLAGVAISLLDCRQSPSITIGGAPVIVFHLIWPSAVGAQPIYQEIVSKTGVNALFFRNAFSVDFDALKSIRDEDLKENYIREKLLNVLISGIDIKPNNDASLLLIIDEVPEDPVEVKFIGDIRDALKQVKNLCIILSGTTSKASNMIGLSQYMATSGNNALPSLWAFIVTRLPEFVPEVSAVKDEWDAMTRDQSSGVGEFKLILKAIQCSISNRGNSRLIIFAIQIAHQLFVFRQRASVEDQPTPLEAKLEMEATFYRWQSAFAEFAMLDKFSFGSYSRSYKGLVGQLNLLLEAAATSDLSDVLLGHHYAFRAIPDNSETPSSGRNSDFDKCGGCLYLSRPKYRAVGSTLFFVRGNPRVNAEFVATYAWQTTRFSPPHADVLLYLMACRETGYFTTNVLGVSCSLRAHELVLSSWRSNAAGLVNFQNPRAVLNTGSLLEVLVTAAVSNAAGRATETHGFIDFFNQFSKELGISAPKTQKLAEDPILTRISMPKLIFPGQNVLLSKRLSSLEGILGSAERQPDDEGYDLLVQAIGSTPADSIRFEMKDRKVFGTAEFIKAVLKLLKGGSNVGVLVVRNCNQYWGERELSVKNRNALRDALVLFPRLGRVYLVNSLGKVETVPIRQDDSAPGRLILLQVPKSSLCEANLP